MPEITNALNFYTCRSFDPLCKLAKPLETLGLDDLTYIYSKPDGHALLIGNQAEVKNYYLSNQLFLHLPLLWHPKNFCHRQATITADIDVPSFQHSQQIMKKRYGGLDNFLVLCRKDGENAHILALSCTSGKVPLNSLFLHHFNSIDRFFDYFLKEWKTLTHSMDSYFIHAKSLLGKSYCQSHPTRLLECAPSKKIAFLNKMGVDLPLYAQFTHAERECIEMLLKVKTAKRIAERLHRSPRTIETHLGRIKEKLGCTKISEAFEILSLYQQHNLF